VKFRSPLDFITRLASLVPKPHVNLTRFHGVFVRGGLPPNSKLRAVVTKAKRGKRKQADVVDDPPTPSQRRASMTWSQSLKRVFNGDAQSSIRSRPHRDFHRMRRNSQVDCLYRRSHRDQEDPVCRPSLITLRKGASPMSPTLCLRLGHHRWASSPDANTKRSITALAAAVAFRLARQFRIGRKREINDRNCIEADESQELLGTISR
jgi:hypothetical protein